jgi:hypothetical protein
MVMAAETASGVKMAKTKSVGVATKREESISNQPKMA